MKGPAVPRGTSPAGRRLWRSVVEEFELAEQEMALLLEAVRTVDSLQLLHEQVEAEGVVIGSPQGPRAHPALVEARQQRIALARLLAALRVPSEADEDERRPQRRGGARGVYPITGAGPRRVRDKDPA